MDNQCTNKRIHRTFTAFAMLGAFSVYSPSSSAEYVGTITYLGDNYEFSTNIGTYVDLEAQLQEQIWWGDRFVTTDIWAQQVVSDFLDANVGTAFYYAHADNGDGTIQAARNQSFGISQSLSYSVTVNDSDTLAYFIATLLPALTLADVQASLLSTNMGLQSALSSTNLLVNGAHSRPMSRRVLPGEKTFWLAGDWGNDNHDMRSGDTGLAEIGGGHNFGPAQVNISIGKTWANQDLIHNGDVDSDGKYIMVEGIIPLSVDNGVYATIGGFRHWGEVDIDRGYFNMGAMDYSSASPDSRAWGVRARVDWENAFTVKTARFSPYADLWHSKTKLDSYTETGGGFPAHFDSREDRITELRAGLNAAVPIKTSGFDFVANVEAVHRFDDKADSTSGQVVGLFGFNLDGQEYDQNWFKGGIGVEGKLGKGKASLMLNGTTEGEMASSWLAASYQLAF